MMVFYVQKLHYSHYKYPQRTCFDPPMWNVNQTIKVLGWRFRFLVGYGHCSCPCKGPLGFIKRYDLQMRYKVLCHSALSSISTKAKVGNTECSFVRGWCDVAQVCNHPRSHLIQGILLCVTFLHCLLTVAPPSQASDVCGTAGSPRALGVALGGEVRGENCIFYYFTPRLSPMGNTPFRIQCLGKTGRPRCMFIFRNSQPSPLPFLPGC